MLISIGFIAFSNAHILQLQCSVVSLVRGGGVFNIRLNQSFQLYTVYTAIRIYHDSSRQV